MIVETLGALTFVDRVISSQEALNRAQQRMSADRAVIDEEIHRSTRLREADKYFAQLFEGIVTDAILLVSGSSLSGLLPRKTVARLNDFSSVVVTDERNLLDRAKIFVATKTQIARGLENLKSALFIVQVHGPFGQLMSPGSEFYSRVQPELLSQSGRSLDAPPGFFFQRQGYLLKSRGTHRIGYGPACIFARVPEDDTLTRSTAFAEDLVAQAVVDHFILAHPASLLSALDAWDRRFGSRLAARFNAICGLMT